jgi:hypothetical protein
MGHPVSLTVENDRRVTGERNFAAVLSVSFIANEPR